jgi:hypothetical protein
MMLSCASVVPHLAAPVRGLSCALEARGWCVEGCAGTLRGPFGDCYHADYAFHNVRCGKRRVVIRQAAVPGQSALCWVGESMACGERRM